MNCEKKIIPVVGAAIIDDGKILMAQRPECPQPYKSLKWEFPGGKIELHETKEAAIKREIFEELDCRIEVDSLLPEVEYEYPDFIIRMTTCVCHLASNYRPKCLEHKAIGWFAIDEFSSLDLAAADARCLSLLRSVLRI